MNDVWCVDGVRTAEIHTVTSYGHLREWTKCGPISRRRCHHVSQRVTQREINAMMAEVPSGAFFHHKDDVDYLLCVAHLSVASTEGDPPHIYGTLQGWNVTKAHIKRGILDCCLITIEELQEDWVRKER